MDVKHMRGKNSISPFEEDFDTAFNPGEQATCIIKSQPAKTAYDLFFKIFIIVPIILTVATILLIVNSSQKLKTYSECSGTIIRFYETTNSQQGSSEKDKSISPVISYTVEGKTYEFTGNYYSTSMKVGQEIKVMYHNEDPSNATVKTGLYVAPMIVGILALTFTLFYIIWIIFRKKDLRKR